jgi:hypothetical protein
MSKYEIIGLAGIFLIALVFVGFLGIIIKDTLLSEK